MKKYESDAKKLLNHLGKLFDFLTDLDAQASREDCFDFPLDVIHQTLLFDVSVLYKVSNVIENRLILEIVKILDPKGLRPDLTEGRRLRLFLDDPDRTHVNEVAAFLNKKISYINVPGVGCDIMGYVYLPESFGGAYLFGGDSCGKEASIKDYEVACVEIMCNFLSTILLKTQFEHQAEYDPLTGLFNSGKIKQKVENILKRHERRPDAMACIAMGDIDFFKNINDTYGHIQGDIILKEVGKILLNSLRGVFDVAGRYGGEEFLLIFDETDQDQAVQIIERLRQKIQATRFGKADKKGTLSGDEFLNITLSFGLALLGKNSDIKNAADWISRADTALYESKQNGRNKTTVFKGR